MPLGASRIAFLAKTSVTVEAEVIRKKVSVQAIDNAQIDTAQSKFGGSSALFDGTGDYLQTGETIDWNSYFGPSASVTIEGWFRFSDTGTRRILFGNRNNFSTFNGLSVEWCNPTSGKLRIYCNSFTAETSSTFSTNTWYHIAMTKSGTTVKLYVDGTEEISETKSYSNNTANDYFYVGTSGYAGQNPMNGYIDEFRISDTVRYTTGFTAPTAPFTNDENTLLLLHMDGTDGSTFFEDDNGVRAQTTGVGNGNVQLDNSRGKFNTTSALFDGTGDYINANLAVDTEIGSGACTWECFFNVDVDAGSGTVGILSNRNGGASNGEVQMLFRNFDMKIQVNGYGTGAFSANGVGSALAVDTWHHYVWARNGSGDWAIWVNGTRVANGTGYTQSLTNDGGFGIGAHADGGIPLNSGTSGWIDEVRISTTDVYGVSNTSITVPTAPFTNNANTILLMHMDGTDANQVFRDDNGKGRSAVAISSEGGALTSTTQSKYGATSISLDGTDDQLVTWPDIDFSSPWTIEFWFYTGSTATQYMIAKTQEDATTESQAILIRTASGKVGTFLSANGSTWGIFNNKQTTSSYSTNTWHHFAVTFDGTNTYKIWFDGTEEGSETIASTVNDSGYDRTLVGGAYGSTAFFAGYMDEVRISNTQRYTTTFTPEGPFTNDADTVMLIHGDGTNSATDFFDDNGYYPNA